MSEALPEKASAGVTAPTLPAALMPAGAGGAGGSGSGNGGRSGHTDIGTAAADDGPEVSWENLNLGKFVAYTTLTSMVENLYFYPVFVLKTRQMVDRSNAVSQHGMARATFLQLREILTKEGVRPLYKGFWSSSVLYTPSYLVYLITYNWLRHKFGWDDVATKKDGSGKTMSSAQTVLAPLVGGLVADLAAVWLYVPVDVIVQRLQLPNSRYTNARVAARLMWREEGWRGFMRGMGATALTSGSASAVWWATYEWTKLSLFRWRDRYNGAGSGGSGSGGSSALKRNSAASWAVQLSAGAFAGAVAACITNPLDIVKTRLQTQVYPNPNAPVPPAVAASSPSPAAAPAAAAALPKPTTLTATAAAAATRAAAPAVGSAAGVASGAAAAAVHTAAVASTASSTAAAAAATSASTAAAAAAAQKVAPPTFYRNTWHGLRMLVRDEGWRALSKGLFPKIVSRAPLSAISSLVYELTLTWSQHPPDHPKRVAARAATAQAQAQAATSPSNSAAAPAPAASSKS